jgi:uncharacterized protein (DUF2236 family)
MRPEPVIARKINREAVVLLGWGRAILMQLAHPLVAAAVRDYSHFDQSAGGYVRRVRRTVGGMLAITFGSTEARRQTVARINGIHHQVRGTLRDAVGIFPAGTPYAAADPELLAWVHATLVDSMIVTYELLVAPLSEAERDQFCVEAAETGDALGVPSDRLPMRVADLRRYLEGQYSSGAIVIGADARALADALFSPPLGPAVPLFRITRLFTIGLLPNHLREGYAFAWDERRARSFQTVARFIRRLRRLLPPMLREWPIARVA